MGGEREREERGRERERERERERRRAGVGVILFVRAYDSTKTLMQSNLRYPQTVKELSLIR